MITTNDDDRADWLRRERALGLAGHGTPSGTLVRRQQLAAGRVQASMSERCADLGRAQLALLDTWQHRRAGVAAAYDAALSGITGLRLPSRPTGAGRHAWHRYAVCVSSRVRPRAALVAELERGGVGTGRRAVPVHQLSFARGACVVPLAGLPGAEQYAEELICLPVYPGLPPPDVQRVAEVLATAVDEHPRTLPG